ncbi:MAG: hypothetical protein J5794_01935 [Lachnospiraceae bacterium]|nr:hypothetical protein [Lachnospiraceae bacterium]
MKRKKHLGRAFALFFTGILVFSLMAPLSVSAAEPVICAEDDEPTDPDREFTIGDPGEMPGGGFGGGSGRGGFGDGGWPFPGGGFGGDRPVPGGEDGEDGDDWRIPDGGSDGNRSFPGGGFGGQFPGSGSDGQWQIPDFNGEMPEMPGFNGEMPDFNGEMPEMPGFNGGNPGEGRTIPEEEGEDTEATNWFEVLLKVVVEFFRALFGKK